MQHRPYSQTVTGLILGLLLTAATSQAATLPAEKLLGPDTLAVVTVPDWVKAEKESANSPGRLFWGDESMKAIKDKFVAQVRKELIEPLEKELGITFKDYAGLAQGQVTFAFTLKNQGPEKEPKPGFLLLMDSGSHSADLEESLGSLRQKWVDSGKPVRKVSIRDIEFNAVKLAAADFEKLAQSIAPGAPVPEEEPDADAEGDSVEIIIGQAGPLLLCGLDQTDLEQVLARQSGGDLRTLADNPIYSRAHAQHFRNSLGHFWLNLKSIVTTIQEGNPDPSSSVESPDTNPLVPSAGKIISALGFDRLECLSMAMEIQPDGGLVTGELRAPGAVQKGIFKMLAFQPKESSPPPFVPADITSFARCRLDLQTVWKTFESTLTELAPPMAGIMAMLVDNAGKDQDPNFDLRKNLIANLGDDLITYEKAPRQQTLEGLNSPPKMVLIQSPKADELANAIKALTSLMPESNARVREREFLGRTVYSMSLPETFDADGNVIRNTLTYVASGSYVALSTDTGIVEEYLRGRPAKSLREEAGLTRAAEKVGGYNSGFFGFENDRETMRNAFTILKKESGTLETLFGELLEGGSLKDWIDLSLLPSFDKVEKYFLYSVYAMKFGDEGLTFKAYTPNPPNYR